MSNRTKIYQNRTKSTTLYNANPYLNFLQIQMNIMTSDILDSISGPVGRVSVAFTLNLKMTPKIRTM